MKKRFLAMALATLTVSALAGCSMKSPEMTSTTAAAAGESTDAKADSKADNKSDGAEVTLVYAEVNPLDTIVGQSGTAFKERLKSFQAERFISIYRQAVYSVLKTMYLTECLEEQVL